MATKATKAKKQRAASKAGQARAPDLSKIYKGKTRRGPTGPYDFRLKLFEGTKLLRSLDDVSDAFDWADEEAALAGNINLHRPDPDRESSLPIAEGHAVSCDVRFGAQWISLWRMRCRSPVVDATAGTIAVELFDEFEALHRGKRRWEYRAGKHRPRGWLPEEIARDVARKSGVKVGALAKGTERIRKLVVDEGSGLDVIQAAYEKETTASGRRFVIRMVNGKLNVLPFARNKIAYLLTDRPTGASLSKAASPAAATILKASARTGKGKDAKKITYTAQDARVVRRLGAVTKEKSYGRVRSRAELVKQAKRDYADLIRVTTTGTVDCPGNPFVRRGETHQVELPGEKMTGSSSFVNLTGVRHSVGPEGYTTSVDFTSKDQFLTTLADQEKAIRAKKRTERKRRKK